MANPIKIYNGGWTSIDDFYNDIDKISEKLNCNYNSESNILYRGTNSNAGIQIIKYSSTIFRIQLVYNNTIIRTFTINYKPSEINLCYLESKNGDIYFGFVNKTASTYNNNILFGFTKSIFINGNIQEENNSYIYLDWSSSTLLLENGNYESYSILSATASTQKSCSLINNFITIYPVISKDLYIINNYCPSEILTSNYKTFTLNNRLFFIVYLYTSGTSVQAYIVELPNG